MEMTSPKVGDVKTATTSSIEPLLTFCETLAATAAADGRLAAGLSGFVGPALVHGGVFNIVSSALNKLLVRWPIRTSMATHC